MTVHTSWRQTIPELLVFFEKHFDQRIRAHHVELGFSIYIIDFSQWKLRLSEATPVIVVPAADLADSSATTLGQSLTDVIRVRKFEQRNPVVLVEGSGHELRRYFRTSFVSVMVLDAEDQAAILVSRRPSGELLNRLSQQVSLSVLSPYETSKPVTGSRFFGREAEVRRIISSDANFAIMGIRRIGKTSLLKEIGERYTIHAQESGDKLAEERVIFLDCSSIKSAEHFMQEIVRKLHPQELTRINHRHFPLHFPDFLNRMAKRYQGPLVFLLDEFDELLVAIANDRDILEALRSSSNTDSARYIVAGFRRLLQEVSNLDSPFFNFVKPLRLKEFTSNEAAAMIIEPMRNLGVHLERANEIVARIVQETASQPNLIQFYCSILIEQLDRMDVRTLTLEMLFSVHESEEFRAFLLNTFMDNTSHLEKAIVFALLVKYYPETTAFDLEAIEDALAEQQVKGFFMDLDQACNNLELAGAFVRKGKLYYFATPIFAEVLMESYNAKYLLRKVIEEGVW
ncbi:MAG: ATP-binding protein [Caldilineaceae bacterium]